jgi:hypothetical protein
MVRVNDRTVRHLISTGYLSLESRDVAASVAIALEAWTSRTSASGIPDAGGDLPVGQPSIVLQQAENGEISSV